MTDITTNYLANLNKRISITTTEIGNVDFKESFALNSRRTASDLSSIGAYLNDVIIKSYSTLCSRPRYPYDVVANGLSADTIVTWLEAQGNHKLNSGVFWYASDDPDSDGRPCTIKESIQYLWANLNEKIIETRENPADLNPLLTALNCHETMFDRLKIDTFGEAFPLDCAEGFAKQRWPIAKHIYEIIEQLTTGHELLDLVSFNSAGEYPDLIWSLTLNDLLDVDVETALPAQGDALVYNQQEDRWEPGATASTEWLNELKDVDTSTSPNSGDILVWDPTHVDSTASDTGAWTPQALVGGPLGQRLGGIIAGTSTLEDIHDMEAILADWRIAWNIPTGLGSDPAAIYDLLKRGVNRYRPGAILQFGGDDKWYSSLAGNTSNFNAVSLVPEIWSKFSPALSNLTELNKVQKVEGGLKPIPFVFINSFRLSLKEKIDPAFSSIIYSENIEAPSGITLNDVDLSTIYSNLDQSVIEGIFNTAPDFSNDMLKNEILAPAKTHPLGMTACSAVYSSDGTTYELEYKPNYLLGVSRTDVSYLFEVTGANPSLFLSNSSNELTGDISSDHIEAIQNRVVNGVGNEVQHSGYSRIMILGPYNVGDNIYICPEPILKLMNIHYPYGICISDTFLTKSLMELLDPADRLAALAPTAFSNFNAGSDSFFSWFVGTFSDSTNLAASEALLGFDPSTMLNDELLADILTSPVGFIVKDDSPRISNTTSGNLANVICRNLLGSTIAPSGASPIQVILSAFYLAIGVEAGFNSPPDGFKLNEIRNLVWMDDLHLPTCKIQLPSLRYDRDLHAGTEGQQGSVGPIGPQGAQGTPGAQGAAGSAGSIGPQGISIAANMETYGSNHSLIDGKVDLDDLTPLIDSFAANWDPTDTSLVDYAVRVYLDTAQSPSDMELVLEKFDTVWTTCGSIAHVQQLSGTNLHEFYLEHKNVSGNILHRIVLKWTSSTSITSSTWQPVFEKATLQTNYVSA
jgi:hypothetical protein